MKERILIRGAEFIYTMDNSDQILRNADLLIEGNKISAIGTNLADLLPVDIVIDGTGKILLPGLVNTHHHFFQNVTRAVPVTERTTILDWLRHCYMLWAGLDPEVVYYAALASAAELLLTGCTTAADFFYLYPRRQHSLFDEEVKAVRELGLRFHGVRGCTPVLEGNIASDLKSYGIDPAELLETDDDIFAASAQVIDRYHDPEPFSMTRVAVGPTATTWDRPEFMKTLKEFANNHGVQTHVHFHPRPDERLYGEKLGTTPMEFMSQVGWLDSNTWFAHATEHTPEEIDCLAATGTGIAHCPSCIIRLGLKVAPIPQMVQKGVKVSIGVDGGASDDGSDMLGELRLAMMLHRIKGVHQDVTTEEWLNPKDVFRLATRGGADVLGRDDIGSLEVGKAADMFMVDLQQVGYAGMHDPLGALVFGNYNHVVDTTIVNGKVVVEGGRLVSGREQEIISGANMAAERLARIATERTGVDFLRGTRWM